MTHFTEKPCAAQGLKSYRYKGPFGFIMIGATDDDDALNEAQRSLCSGAVSPYCLQKWCKVANCYVPVID